MKPRADSTEHRIVSVGHSNHELPDFLQLLRRAGVTAIADVRSSPFSQRLPHFNRPLLEAALKQAGIVYVFLGDLVGGRPRDDDLYDAEGRADYEAIRATKPFQQGLDRLCRATERFTVALLCGEAEPLHCHRGLMIAPALAERGVAVGHLRKDGSLESAAEFEKRLFEETGVGDGLLDGLFAATLTDDDRAQLKRAAYLAQAHKVAFRRRLNETDTPLSEEDDWTEQEDRFTSL